MAIDKNSNWFTYVFAAIIVVVVASLLSYAAMSLAPAQKANMKQEQMQNILATVGVDCSREDSEKLFSKYIKERLILNSLGEVVFTASGEVKSGNMQDAFNIDIQKQFRDKSITEKDFKYPLYNCEVEGKTIYVIPMVGKGLWGPIWGFVSLGSDKSSVLGAKFDHKSETPGLGAEISLPVFQEQFKGEQIFNSDSLFMGIKVVKGGADSNDKHGVDAITGGTITSNGVNEMLGRTLKIYEPYLKK